MTTTSADHSHASPDDSGQPDDAARVGEIHPTEVTLSDLSSAFHTDVRRRAMGLCVPAEPHTEARPCAKHIREALGQLFSTAGHVHEVAQGSSTGTGEGGSGFWV